MEGVSSFVRPTLPSKILEPKTEESPEKTRSGSLSLQEVSDGLKIKLGQQIIFSLTYGHTCDPKPVDWKVLAAEDEAIEGEHIRCLPLKEGEDLGQLVEQFQSAHAKAIVFVNTREDFMVEAQHWPKESAIPVLLLKTSDGKQLLTTVDTNSEVFGQVQVESRVDAGHTPNTAVTQEPTAAQAVQPSRQVPERRDREGAIEKMKTFFTGDKHNLNTDIKQLMFSNDTPVIVSEDSGTFTMVMSTFQQYERAGKSDGSHGDVLKRIVKYLNNSDLFERDFPFYIILAHRIRLNRIYKCDDSPQFFDTIIDKMETLDLRKLSSTLNAFFQRGDFPVMFGQQDSNCNVFKLLETACLEMSMMAAKRQKLQVEGGSPEHLVYKRMVWVSVALKCHSEAGAVTRRVADIWNRYLVQMKRELVFNAETTDALRRGLSLTKFLNIPPASMMNSDQLIQLANVEDSVRPFSHLMNYLDCVAGFIATKDDVAHLVTTLRASYQSLVYENHPSLLKSLSVEGTVAGAIQEGIIFVDKLSAILKQKELKDELCSCEGLCWLLLLLQLVDVTKSGAEEHLMKFFAKGRTMSESLKTHRAELTKDVIERIRQSFPQLPIHLFFPLYKNLRMWPSQFVEEYLSVYKIPPGIRICDGTWNAFISEVIDRHPGAHNHRFLLEFIKGVGTHYSADRRPLDFILDLLDIKVPKLFALPENTDKGYTVAVEVQGNLSTFVQEYIKINALKTGLLLRMSKILSSISEQLDDFQQLILTVIQKEVIPELRVLQSGERPAQEVLSAASAKLQKDLSWIQALNPQQKFCWGIVATCCQKTATSITTDSFDWVHSCDYIVSQLGQIYASYCNGKKLPESQRNLSDPLPQDIVSLHSDDVYKFFEWIRKLQTILLDWQKKFVEDDCNYDDILLYASNQSKLLHIGQLVCSKSIIIDPQDIQLKMIDYLTLFEKVNAHLIKYIPGNPDVKYSTLPHILHRYGVAFPSKFKKHFLFPGEKVSGERLLENPLSPCTTGLFQPPGQNTSLQATKGLTMRELTVLTEQLDRFVKPLLDHMDMLVFFSLHQCEIFNNYLHLQLMEECSIKQPVSVQPSMRPSISFSTLRALTKDEGPKEEGVSLQILAKTLNTTRSFLAKLIQGTAKYSEIIAEGGKLTLESINIEAEFNTLATFFATVMSAPQVSSDEGLKGICSMLELFQYTSFHIPAIYNVCQQYNIEGCLSDTSLKAVVRLAEEVERSRANLTPLEAVGKIQLVKNSLYHKKPGAYSSLGLFPAVANSAAFFQFVRDKRFDGEKGQAAFGQQYQLITAQLQHEEYNENVLNHLYAAYKFILPFMDTKQNFNSLMTKVTSLDVSGGLKQLETVNSNITLIRLWFSRAEGDTLQNVAKDLDSIIQTGHYQFEFSSTEAIVISLHYCHAGSAQATPSGQPSSLEEGLPQRPQTVKKDDKEGSGKERWSKEQIDDFVRKLGFLDAEKEGGDKIKHFLRLNETANTMLKLYTQLRDLGCADFTKGAKHITLPCITEDPDSLVHVIEAKLSAWKDELSKLCDQNIWMLFFRTPKLLLLHKDLSDWMSLSCLCDLKSLPDMKQKMETMSHIVENEAKLLTLKHELSEIQTVTCSLNDWTQYSHRIFVVCKELMNRAVRHIVREVSFLCTNDVETFGTMKEKVETVLIKCQHELMKCQTPMLTISMFLSELLLNHSLPTRIKTARKSTMSVAGRMSITPECSQVLHSCPGFTQNELIPLILSIFDGIPEPFQMFHCQSSSTQEELDLFLQRAAKFAIPHLILEVNRLPFQLQEHLMKFHLHIERSQSVIRLCLQYIETKPSNLRDIPWITLKEHKMEPESMRKVQRDKLAQSLVQLVFGNAGDGKTHYIKSQLKQCPSSCTISVNEAFTPLGAIKKLRRLAYDKPDGAIFFNFTLLPPGGKNFPLHNLNENLESEDKQTAEHTLYRRLIEVIGWFFFDLLILGYVEDRDTGLSFRLPGGLDWVIYVEVPSRDLTMTPEEMLEQFCGDIPILGLLGSPHKILNEIPFLIDEEVQLVCKYLKAHKEKRIDRLYKVDQLVMFSSDPIITEEECLKLLDEFMPRHIRTRKITQRLFIKYMNTRCYFLDHLPAFNYNTGVGEYIKNTQGEQVPTNTRTLGSTLIEAMLKEVSDFCDPAIKENWSINPHQQLIYDMSSIDLITLHADKLSSGDRAKFTKIGVKVPSMMEMHTRDILDKYLSKALCLELKDGRLKQIDEANYVLTLDYTLKMLNIHERYRCGVPVIIEGETGVGKTALVQMLSALWNHSLLSSWNTEKGRIHDMLTRRIGDLSEDSCENYMKCVQLINQLSEDKHVSCEDMQLLCNLPGSSQSSKVLSLRLKQHLLGMRHLPVVKLLVTKEKTDLGTLFAEAEANNTVEATAKLLQAVYFAQLKSTFYKLNIHAAMTPLEIQELLKPAFDQARELQQQLDLKHDRIPFVTVFLDEVNTSSCLGLLKEFIVDRTLDGEPIPENMFVVAACNPHRGNSLASHEQDRWLRGSYYVRPLHPTLQLITWDYGSLDTVQESDYINAKMKMLHQTMSNVEIAGLTDLIVESQEVMRHYAEQLLKSHGVPSEEAKIASHSCVSQRDIQRVFTLHEWLMKGYASIKPYGDRTDYHRRAVLVALGIVYYMRLNTKFREAYKDLMDKGSRLPNEVRFSQAFNDELNWYIDEVEIPQGIAKTQALKENIFATIICTITRIPLIIVGAPGSSKTLSFNITVANLKGQESKMPLFRHTDKYPSLDPHYYQCSRRTTSNEIQTVFSRAINRQKSHLKISLPINCVVFMDEAGLPEESHESLKVLHYYLDNPEVSFVAITNHVLDAAKTNRAISLFRPESSADDLETLAKGCLCSDPDNPPPELKNDLSTIAKLCRPYLGLMEQKEFKQFFGLRDFIHFVNYLRRKHQNTLNAQVVLEALERNFNGSDEFEHICKQFLLTLGARIDHVTQRQILDILRDSLADRPNEANRTENEVRYKLMIDPSEDDSLVRLLFTFGVLDRQKTRVFVCSDFPGDTHLQKINTIAAIRHSAIEGHTVVMAQTDDIHESFYDLFNQRFRRIDDAHGPRYYANIAIGAHSKPCRVHPEFQCVVVVKQSEVKNTPAPFLNRFEKYRLTHHSLLEAALCILPPCMAVLISTVREKVNDFVGLVRGKESFYGLKEETTDSLLLSMLPTEQRTYQPYEPKDDPVSGYAIDLVCLQELIRAFRTSAGFHIPTCSLEELTLDAQHVSYLVCSDPEFQGLLQNITPQGVVQGVADAMQKLHEAPSPQGGNVPNVGLSAEGCMMLALGVQWLVRHLCKRLMQLMTPEALTVHRMKMDSSYLVNYLKHHSHFSLKVLIRDRLDALNHTTVYFPTKLLCYTRTSPLVHKLPSSYSGSGFYARGVELAHEAIRDLVLDDLAAVLVHKLSNKPQSSIRELLKTFVMSESAQVLLLIANMAEVTLPMVNHLRIMIEEAENQNQCSQMPKLFVLLLHFPPHNFLNPCYPTLYLRGWDHYYLDTIGHHIGNGVIDVEDWFSHCCFTHDTNAKVEEDSLVQTAKGLLEEAIPVISSRVPFSSHGGFPFNGQLTISQRERLLHELLITKDVGGVLCHHFRSYWQPSVMSGYLEQAASLAHQQQSTLNITDTIQAAFKATFMDFVVVMVSRMNENCNIDSVFVNGGSPVVDALYRDLLAVSPLPPLTQLKVLSNNLQPPCNPGYVPVFPFFHLVMGHMDQLVEQCRRDANEGADVLGNGAMVPSSQLHDMQTEFTNLQVRMLCCIKEREESTSKESVVTCVQAVVRNPELWTSYFNNFIVSKLHLTSSESIIEKQIVQEVFGNLTTLDVIDRIVYLHAYVAVYQLDLAKVATTLRSLAQIEKIKPVSSNILSPPPLSPTKQFMYSIRQSGSALSIQQLSSFVISALFNALLGCMYGGLPQAGALEQLKKWYRAYLDITTLPSLADNISTGLDGSAEMELTIAQFNVMQVTFFVLQCKPDCDVGVLNMGQKVFCTLFTRHFKESGELKGRFPQLAEVCHVAVECIKASPSEDDQVHRLTERIFNHFFPANSTNCSSDDCRWFFAYANSQIQWLTKGTEAGIGGQVDLEAAQNGCHTNDQMSIHILKLYLSRILGEQSGGTSSSQPLAFYNDKRRFLLGEVLMSTPDLGPPAHYIPTFYQQSTLITLERGAISARMQQPLAHLYFLTLMEHLVGKPQGLPALLRTYFTIFELCRSTTKTNEEKILLYIELQAVVQAIVQQVAIDLDPSEPSKMRQLSGIKKEVNSILDDPTTGGGACKGHTLVLALHLLKRLKSFRKFTELLTVKFEIVCQGINCLEQFSVELKEQAEPNPHLFPLMAEGHPLGNLYQRVHKAMLKIHDDGKANIDELIKLANECFTAQKASAAAHAGVDTRGAFKMAVWLTVYYDFFDKNKKSELLCNAIGGDKLSRFFEEGDISIIQRFLNPELMLTTPELPNPLREDEEVLVLQPGGRQAKPKQRRGKPEDPLLELFRPPKGRTPDQSDVDLRHALANMIAVVIASPKASNHLWYHMFAPGDLVETFMTGFMYDTKVSPNGLHYDCGVELSPDGQFGRQDYLKHAGRGTYTLHSLYLLLWANFGAFCVALLTQPNADKKLHGTIISDWLSIRHYCVSQLRTIWLYMRNNLNISDEERSFLLMRCMNRFYELSTNPTRTGIMQGKFVTREQLDSYERLWHAQIYQPSWSELKEAFSQYSREWQNPVFFSIRHLDEQYPHFPSEKDFIHNLLSSGDISLQKQGGGLYMLTQFVLERPQLMAGGCLLPDLVEFYLWLHTQLAYIVSYDKAAELKIGQVVERAVERYSKDFGTHIKELYERVKVGYNAYVETIGQAIGAGACVAVRRGNKVYTIADEMPLLHFLSDTTEEEEGNDWLYTVMADIVNTHNNFIQGLYTMTRSQGLSVYHLLPSDPSKIPLTEFTLNHCIVGKKSCLHEIDSFLQLVRSRYSPQRAAYIQEGVLPKALKNPIASVSGSVVQQQTACQFDLHLLQEDVVATYLAGKPPVESAAAIRTHFKFRNVAQQSSPHPTDVASSGGDIDTLGDQLPELFKAQCDDSTTKKMEFEFHSAGYLTLLEAVQAMKNVLGHLINFIKGNDDLNSVKSQTIRQFMSNLDSQIDQSAPVFAKSSTPTLSPPQLKFLENLPTVMVFSCLQKFIQWLKDGMYDFHTLPFTLKTHLSPEDQEALLQIPEKWKGGKSKLLDELKSLTGSLVHSEAHFSKNTNETLQMPMKKILEDFHFISQDDMLPMFIPNTICVQHYVAFRVVLRSLVATVQQHVADVEKVEVEKWQEFVGDIWDKRLPHFRDFPGDGGVFLFNPRTGTYGFVDALEEDDQRPLLDVLDDDPAVEEPPMEGNEESTINDSEEWEVVGSADDGVSASVDALRRQMRDNPHLREQLLSLARTVQEEKVALEELAKAYTVDDVLDFLHSIRMDQYIQTFRDEGVDGTLLVAFGEDELKDLGISSRLHCFKIQFLFKRTLQSTPTTHALVVVLDFLAANNMDKYRQRFCEEGVDGDMLFEILQLPPNESGNAILEEIGVSRIDKVKMRQRFKPAEGQ